MIPVASPSRRWLLAGVFSSALVQLAATIVVAQSLHTEARVSPALIAAAITVFLAEVLQRRLCEAVGLSYAAEVREHLFRHLMAVEPAIIQRRRHGAMLQSFVGDLTAVRQWVSDGIMRGLVAVLAFTGLLGWLALSQPRIAALIAAIITLIIVAGAAVLPFLTRAVKRVRRERGRVAAFASERLAAQATVLICARANSETARLNRRVERLNQASLRRAGLTGIMRALPHLGATAMLAAVLLNQQPGSAGVASGVVATGILALALRDLARAAELMIPGRIGLARIRSLLGLPRQSRSIGLPRRSAGTGFELASLHVVGSETSLEAQAASGEIVVVDGEPELRRRLFETLAGLATAKSGDARWKGRSLVARSSKVRRHLVGIASATLPIVSGSAALNIRYRLPNLKETDLQAIADYWGIAPSSRLCNPVSLNLIRAVAGKPPVLLLDLAELPVSSDDVQRLRRLLPSWEGVVLIATADSELRALANRRWLLDGTGLEEKSALISSFESHSLGDTA
ncbi:ABC transporter transmembrane domain-containing protein [Sphingomonas sp. GCM10030256]|uniref:ABC transporter transmembrane domain-containing protein n=1 Tax=Sphingomonas sp. GCM10030256 TaxID=3273427 RepID=UPI00360DC0CC